MHGPSTRPDPTAERERRLTAAFLSQAKTSAIFSFLVTPIVAIELFDDHLVGFSALWVAAVISVSGLRLAIATYYLRFRSVDGVPRVAIRILEWSVPISGFLWGLVSLHEFISSAAPADSDNLVFAALVLAVATGLPITVTARPRLAMLAAALTLGPGAFNLLFGTRFEVAAAVLAIVWLGFVQRFGARLHAALRGGIEMEIKNESLIEDLKEKSDVLAVREAYFRALTEGASDVVMNVAPDATVRYASPSASATLGIQPSEIVGRRLFDIVHPDDVDRVRQVVSNADRRHGPIELRLRNRDRAWLSLETT
ncbi:MAG: PAS domain S-box protein [Alphaproteobacteria bacterium]|nr:PAS domain S-box protein [Alphaproteobacteria bacterium]